MYIGHTRVKPKIFKYKSRFEQSIQSIQRAQQPKPKDSAPAECSPDLGEVFKNLPYFAVLIDGTPGIPIGFNIYFKTCIYYIDWSTISLWRGIPIVFWVPRCIFCNQCWTRNPNDEKKIAAQSINMHIALLRLLCSLGLGQTISAKTVLQREWWSRNVIIPIIIKFFTFWRSLTINTVSEQSLLRDHWNWKQLNTTHTTQATHATFDMSEHTHVASFYCTWQCPIIFD